MSKYWLDYVKSCYDLVIESEGTTDLILPHEVEAYVVHLMAKNFERTDIGQTAIAIKMLSVLQSGTREQLLPVADECLLIYSYPFKRSSWPSPSYYRDMGITAYGLADHVMEKHFESAGKILSAIFSLKYQPRH
jgi:hypothetical protein